MAKGNVSRTASSDITDVSASSQKQGNKSSSCCWLDYARELEIERDALLKVAAAAELVFEHDGEVSKDPTKILREALRSAAVDFGLIGNVRDEAVDSMTCARAEYRCDLALSLYDYRAAFGYPPDDEPEAEVQDAGDKSDEVQS